VGRLVKRLIADGLQEVDDYEAIKAFRRRRGRTVALVDVKKRRLSPISQIFRT